MKKNFVAFYSPGTFFHETSILPIEEWNVEQAIGMSETIIERYNAKPFGFQFLTRERLDNELDSKKIAESPMYYLGGNVLTLEDVKKRNDPKDEILISNMECNGWNRIIENRNSWSVTQPLQDSDVILDLPRNG